MTRRLGLALALSASVLTLFGCAGEASGPGDYVRAAAFDSREAERAEEAGDHNAAIEALERLIATPVPPGMAEDDARVIRQDAHDRLARARLAAGDLAGARAAADAGLALGERDDLFTANLFTTRGRVNEADGRDRDAAADYERALEINEALLDDALGGALGDDE